MKNIKIYIISFLILLAISFFAGMQYYKKNHLIIPTSDTTYIYDTTYHNIPYDVHHYHHTVDTEYVDVPANVDTASILKDYYNIYTYNNHWEDSIVKIDVEDVVTQNKIIYSSLNYRILKPSTTIVNTTNITNYNSYLTLSLNSDFEFKYPSLNLNYINKRYNLGVGYMPKNNAIMINAGVTIFKF